jgi:hypothetical protein
MHTLNRIVKLGEVILGAVLLITKSAELLDEFNQNNTESVPAEPLLDAS